MVAQILDPRICNSAVSQEDRDEFRKLLVEEYGMKQNSSDQPNKTKRETDISALISAARTARKESLTTTDEIYDFSS